MKQIDFSQEGGFPLAQDHLGIIQGNGMDVSRAQAGVESRWVGSIPYATNYIIKGCYKETYEPNTFTGGYVFYNGEVYRVESRTYDPEGAITDIPMDSLCFDLVEALPNDQRELLYLDGETRAVVSEMVMRPRVMVDGAPTPTVYWSAFWRQELSLYKDYELYATRTLLASVSSWPDLTVTTQVKARHYRNGMVEVGVNGTLEGLTHTSLSGAPQWNFFWTGITMPIPMNGCEAIGPSVEHLIPVEKVSYATGTSYTPYLDNTGAAIDYVKMAYLSPLAGGSANRLMIAFRKGGAASVKFMGGFRTLEHGLW